jgi:hypothetical protein
MRRSPARRLALAAFSLLLGAAILGAELETLEHHLTTQHAVCPEHGLLVHVGKYGEARQGPVEKGLRSARRTADDHGHRHCALVVFLRIAAPAEPAAALVAEFAAREGPLLAERPSLPPIPALVLAPKSSPPAAV